MIVKITKLLGFLAFCLISGCMSDNNRSETTYKKSSAAKKNTCTYQNAMECSNRQLCNSLSSVIMRGEARIRGLACVNQAKVAKQQVKTFNNITKSVEIELNRLGCDAGQADGAMDDRTLSGLYRLTDKVGIEFDIGLLKDQNFLRLIKSFSTNTCSKASTSTASNSTPKKACLPFSPEVCSAKVLCDRSTNINKLWTMVSSMQGYVNEAKKRGLTCGVGAKNTVKKTPPVTNPKPDNSAELRQLRQERELLEANLLATQQLIKQQKRAAERPYKACLANCLLNNKAGKGFSAALSGMAQCNSSCAPLKWGGAVVPPSWEKNQKRLKRVDCMITRMSKNQATASCTQY